MGKEISFYTPIDFVYNEISFPLTYTNNLLCIVPNLYSFCNKNCIQPEDGHSINGRNM